jgi:hypothetical protein
MVDDRAFFQIAAALLPALMFGALLTDRLRPPKTIGRHYGLAVFGVVAVATFLLLAETIAIEVAITGEPTSFERAVVVIAVMIASGGTLAVVLHPWLAKLPSEGRTTQVVGAVVLLAVVVLGSIRTLDSAIRFTTTQEQADQVEALIRQENALQRRRTTGMRAIADLSARRDKLLSGRPGTRNRGQAAALKYLIDLQEADLRSIGNEEDLLSQKLRKLAQDMG